MAAQGSHLSFVRLGLKTEMQNPNKVAEGHIVYSRDQLLVLGNTVHSSNAGANAVPELLTMPGEKTTDQSPSLPSGGMEDLY